MIIILFALAFTTLVEGVTEEPNDDELVSICDFQVIGEQLSGVLKLIGDSTALDTPPEGRIAFVLKVEERVAYDWNSFEISDTKNMEIIKSLVWLKQAMTTVLTPVKVSGTVRERVEKLECDLSWGFSVRKFPAAGFH